MYAPNVRSGQSTNETTNSPNAKMGHQATHSRRRMKKPSDAIGRLGGEGEGYQKLKSRLISHGIPESVVDELFEQPTIVNYTQGSFIFLQGATTDLLFWVSSGLVDLLCPGPNGEQFRASVLGPGELFGFIESTDYKGRPAQAFQARARTNVQIGFLTREHICRVLKRQDPSLLLHILQEIVAAWSELTLYYTQFLGKNCNSRLETVLVELANKFGAKESRGTLLIPEFGHSDFAEMIGSSRPMVSKLISDMIGAGSLAQDGRHYIVVGDLALKNKNGKRSSG